MIEQQGGVAGTTGIQADRRDMTAVANRLLELRRRRNLMLGGALFGEPTWDMLLDLYIAQQNGHKLSVSSLCVASGVPPTTALRKLNMLIDKGLLVRQQAHDDGRRSYISLSDATFRDMERLLGWWLAQGGG